MATGLRAYSATAREWAGGYSVGDKVTIADVCLVPAWWNAERFGVDLGEFDVLGKVMERLLVRPAVVAAHYANQPDTSKGLRVKP